MSFHKLFKEKHRVAKEAAARWNEEFSPGVLIAVEGYEGPGLRTYSPAYVEPSISDPLVQVRGIRFPVSLYDISPYHEKFISKAEAKVLKLLAKGFNASDAGRILRIKRQTAQASVKKMMSKLEFKSISQLIKFAEEQGLAPFPKAPS